MRLTHSLTSLLGISGETSKTLTSVRAGHVNALSAVSTKVPFVAHFGTLVDVATVGVRIDGETLGTDTKSVSGPSFNALLVGGTRRTR